MMHCVSREITLLGRGLSLQSEPRSGLPPGKRVQMLPQDEEKPDMPTDVQRSQYLRDREK